MATSGSLTVTMIGGGVATCTWKVTATNYANNNYTVNFTTTRSGKCDAVEVSVKVGSTYIFDVGGSTTASVNKNATLNSGATFELWMMAYYQGDGEANWKNFTLNTIDRKSYPTLSPTSVTLGHSLTLTTNRKASSFTHTIYGGFSTSSLSSLATGVGASTTLSFPVNTYASQITDRVSKTYYLRTRTFSGSTNLGDVDKTVKLTVPSDLVPSLSNLVAEDTWCYRDLGVFYNRHSILAVHGTEALSYSSPITSRTLTFNGASAMSTTSATVTLPDPISLDVIPQTPLDAYFSITDGRGRTADASVSIPVINYALEYDPVIYRSDANGNENPEGTYITLDGTYTKTSIPDENDNEQNFVYIGVYINDSTTPIFESGNVDSSDAVLTNGKIIIGDSNTQFAINSTYEVKVIYGDAAGGYRELAPRQIPTALRPISINSDGSGISFGIPCTAAGMEIAYSPLNITADVTVSADANKNIDGTVTATSFINSSDARLKRDITPITNAEQIINNLRPVTYKWNGDTGDNIHHGFIAQEVEEVMPENVSVDKNGMLGINYSEFIAPMIAVMQSQEERIAELEKLVERNSTYEKEIH